MSANCGRTWSGCLARSLFVGGALLVPCLALAILGSEWRVFAGSSTNSQNPLLDVRSFTPLVKAKPQAAAPSAALTSEEQIEVRLNVWEETRGRISAPR